MFDHGNFLPHTPLDENKLVNHLGATHNAFKTQTDAMPLPGTFSWWCNDTEKRYIENLELMPEDWHYRTKPVHYSINEHGYRTIPLDEVDWSRSVVMFGCSELMGMGLADDERICYQLSKLLDVPVINLGKNATSINFSLYNNLVLKRSHKPLGVVNQWTELSRHTHFGTNSKTYTALPSLVTYYAKMYNAVKSLFGFTFEDWENDMLINASMQVQCARELWENTPYAEATWNKYSHEVLDCKFIERDDMARDIYRGGHMFDDSIVGHIGPKTARLFAEHYAEQLNL